jgi:hypothetical protein
MKEEKSGKEAELTLWVITSIRHSSGVHLPAEINFIYAQDEEEANEVLIRWKELHLDYIVQSFEPHPEGAEKDGRKVEGKRVWEGS